MPRISTDNYDTVASWNGSQDLFVVEQPDGTKVATPAMVKQFIEAGDFEATGEVKDGHGNILNGLAATKAEKPVFTYSPVTGTQTIAGRSYTQIFSNLPAGKYLISCSYVNQSDALCILTKSRNINTNFADMGPTGGVGICELSSASDIYLYVNVATTVDYSFYRCRFVAIKLD